MIREETRLMENPELIPKKVSLVIKKFKGIHERKDEKRQFFEDLKKSNNSLEQKLKDITSTANCAKEQEQAETVKLLLNEMVNLENQLKTEKEYLRDLEDQIRQAESQKLKITKGKITKKGQAKQVLDDTNKVEKSKEVWKEKLHVASCHLSNELTKNAALREKIKGLLSERKVFNKDYNTLLEKLKNGKKLMEELTASIKNTFHLRQNIINKIEKIHLKEKKQMKLQEEEAQELELKKEYEIDWKKFYLKKSKHRQTQNIATKKRKSLEGLQDTLEDHKWLVKKIMEMCDEEGSEKFMDYSDLIAVVKNYGHDVTALINFVTQQNHEIQALTERVLNQGKKYEEISLQEEEKQFMHELQRRNLEAHKESLEELRLNSDDDKRGQQKVLDKLYSGIQNLVDMTEAEVSPLLLLLGENEQITGFNYTLFLQAVETKIILLFGAYNIPRSILTLNNRSISTTKIKSSKAGESQKSYRKPQDVIEDRKTISVACQICYPQQLESKVTQSL